MRSPALLFAILVSGCAPTSGAMGHALPLETTDVEVVVTPTGESPPGSDAEPLFLAEIRAGDASRTLAEPVLAAMAWNGGAAVVRRDHTLVYEHVDGRTIEVAPDVFGPVASPDASHLAYAVRGSDDTFDVVVHDGSRPTLVAHDLVSAGAFRFSDDARLVAFIGAENGELAGAWVARANGAGVRCMTLCDIRVGDSAITGGLVTPLGPEDFLEIREGLFRWRDEAGAPHDVRWEMP